MKVASSAVTEGLCVTGAV